jgi:alkanesulfonate monooxygenase SsuD/methylene tetrahydromethanopterin reductase-like flavin-dependent oxidoreductase (luciferase family)
LIGLYKQHFQASELQPKPYAILTMSAFCADDEQQAKALQLTYDLNLYRFFTGQSDGKSLTPQQAQNYVIGPQEKAFIAGRENSRAAGTPQQVKQQILALAEQHQADEIMLVTNMYYFEDRKRSFELISKMFR